MHYDIYTPNFGAEISARALAELARDAEHVGWDASSFGITFSIAKASVCRWSIRGSRWLPSRCTPSAFGSVRHSRRSRVAVHGSWPVKPSRGINFPVGA